MTPETGAREIGHDAQLVPLDSLKPYGKNPRRGNVEVIRESLRANGQYRPLVVRAKTREVLAGNHTLQAAREEGWSEVWATFIDCDAKTAKRIVLVDNRSNDVATYDDEMLADLLGELPSLDGTGYEDADLERLVQFVARQGDDTEPIDAPKKPQTKPGELIELGEHRLLCGDAFDRAALDRLFAEGRPAVVLTDPPYGIGLNTDYRSMGTGSAKAILKGTQPGKYRKVAGDDAPFDASSLAEYFSAVPEQFWFGGDYYRRTLSGSDLDGSYLVWDKRNEESDAGFGSGFELIWSRQRHKRDLLRHYYFGAFGADGANREHPTQKPVPLLSEILTRWTKPGALVADPFCGSGTTLIACENLGRRCYAMEIDPAYCDVIRDRYERHVAA